MIKKCRVCKTKFEVADVLADFIHYCNPCAMRADSVPPPASPMPKSVWRDLVSLCHPDRFEPGSRAHNHALIVTRWLLDNRPEDSKC